MQGDWCGKSGQCGSAIFSWWKYVSIGIVRCSYNLYILVYSDKNKSMTFQPDNLMLFYLILALLAVAIGLVIYSTRSDRASDKSHKRSR